MLTTLLGMVISVSDVQFSNALTAMLVRLRLRVADFSAVQP